MLKKLALYAFLCTYWRPNNFVSFWEIICNTGNNAFILRWQKFSAKDETLLQPEWSKVKNRLMKNVYEFFALHMSVILYVSNFFRSWLTMFFKSTWSMIYAAIARAYYAATA